MKFVSDFLTDFAITCHDLRVLNAVERQAWVEELHRFSVKHVAEATPEYLSARAQKYNSLAVVRALATNEIVGFGFADIGEIRLASPVVLPTAFSLGVRVPWIHFGLMIIGREFRGRRMSLKITKVVAQEVRKRMPWRFRILGTLVTAKCSSPISFMRLHIGSHHMALPRIKSSSSLDSISRSSPARYLSRKMCAVLSGHDSDDFLIRGVNEGSGFALEEETFSAHDAFQDRVIEYFKQHVLPKNELLFVAWCPAAGLWH